MVVGESWKVRGSASTDGSGLQTNLLNAESAEDAERKSFPSALRVFRVERVCRLVGKTDLIATSVGIREF
jgi:hypothetical protein